MYAPPPSPAIDATLTTRPQPRSSIAGRKVRVHRNVPVAFTASTRFQSSSAIRWTGAEWPTPALLIRTSTCPSQAVAARASSATLCGSETSQRAPQARCPAATSSAATASTLASVRAATTTAAPASASARTTAFPIPWPPPVTTAPRPASVVMRPRRARPLPGSSPGRRWCALPPPRRHPPDTRSSPSAPRLPRSSSVPSGSP